MGTFGEQKGPVVSVLVALPRLRTHHSRVLFAAHLGDIILLVFSITGSRGDLWKPSQALFHRGHQQGYGQVCACTVFHFQC